MPPLQHDELNRFNTTVPITSNKSFGNQTTKRKNTTSSRAKIKDSSWGSQLSKIPSTKSRANSIRQSSKGSPSHYNFADPVKTSRRWNGKKRSAFLSEGDNDSISEDHVINFGCSGCAFSFYKFHDDLNYVKNEILVKSICQPLYNDVSNAFGKFASLFKSKESKHRRRETQKRWDW